MTLKRSFLSDFATKVLVPSILAAGGIATLLLYVVNGIFNETNRLDSGYARQAANSALSATLENLGSITHDNAVWDDAVANSYGKINADWMDGTWGEATAQGIYDHVNLIDRAGTTLYSASGGARTADTVDSIYGREIQELLAAMPPEATRFKIATGVLRNGGKLYVVAAAPVLPTSVDIAIPDNKPRYLVFGRIIDDRLLAELSRRFVLNNLRVTPAVNASPDAVTILSPAGHRIGTLTWNERSPGDILKLKYSNVIQIMLSLFLFVIVVLIYTSWRGFRDAHASQTDAVKKSLRDDLTGLANRRELISVLSDRLAEARIGRTGLSLVYADLDGFKEVNDSYGHEIGDLLLKAVAAGFAHLSGDFALVARLGGDEFAIIVTGDNSRERSRELARNMIAFLSEPMVFGGRVASVSVSVGIVDLEKDDADVEEIIRRADVAMYAAKSAGRNRLHIYDKSLDFKRDESRGIARALREHIDLGRLSVVYQPIVDARTRRVRGVEALVRWPRQDRIHYTPDIFIPVAEESGLIEDLGYFVLSEACRQAAQWPDIFVSVNVSPVQFMNPGFAELVGRILSKTGLPPTRLELEVTEGFIIDNADRANSIINRLHDMRVGVALDDFGTGFSSIGHLRRFKFDKLKLDRSMVTDILWQPSALRLVQGTIAMADALGLMVVAEGVEDENQVSVLRLAGCSQFQGFLFSRPVSATEIAQMLNTSVGLAATA
jgi:diguanylate cyclase (GGDEF)-like protein